MTSCNNQFAFLKSLTEGDNLSQAEDITDNNCSNQGSSLDARFQNKEYAMSPQTGSMTRTFSEEKMSLSPAQSPMSNFKPGKNQTVDLVIAKNK